MIDRLGRYLLGPNDTPENGIYTGDAKLLSKAIPDESVDLIFTDPVYQNIDDYRWLGEMAARVLKPKGSLLCYQGSRFLDSTFQAFVSTGLEYRWLFVIDTPGEVASLFYQRLNPTYVPLLWLDRDRASIPACWIRDSIPRQHRNRFHKWSKGIQDTRYYLVAFCAQGDVTLDPFTGGGTVPAVCKMLGRRYLAFEIDPDVAETARERVRMTQMPLFVLEPEQMALTSIPRCCSG